MKKTLPFGEKQLIKIIETFPTPFYLYDEQAIRENARDFYKTFNWIPEFKNFFAVKALPNPYILKILKEEGFGSDCSSLAELILSEKVGLKSEGIMFTSNDTPSQEFVKARALGAIINLDDITHIDYLAQSTGNLPDLLFFRYNPGYLKSGGNVFIGNPKESKYGLTKKQLFKAYKKAQTLGVKRFGLHTMVVSNELNASNFVEVAKVLFEVVREINEKLKIKIEFINMGGGIGIPYRPGEERVDLDLISRRIKALYEEIIVAAGLSPLKIYFECGRYITGPYGYLVTKVIHQKNTYKNYLGVDACMANLMRPGMYGAYHHETVLGKETAIKNKKYDVVGSLCENNDKFAINRKMPEVQIGDIIVIHDAGAHGYAMGFNYNGKLKCSELLLKPDGQVELIRRAETVDDYFATLDFSNL